jgi:hypothetical protein
MLALCASLSAGADDPTTGVDQCCGGGSAPDGIFGLWFVFPVCDAGCSSGSIACHPLARGPSHRSWRSGECGGAGVGLDALNPADKQAKQVQGFGTATPMKRAA